MINEWQINVTGFGLVRVSESLISQLTRFRQLEPHSVESGGVLLGKHLRTGGSVLIDQLTMPRKTDKQGRTHFFRSEEHNKLVNDTWKSTGGHSTYVGLWHTHPEPLPQYSSTDCKDWVNALDKSAYEGTRLFFAIVGQSHIRMWMGDREADKEKVILLGEYELGK